MTTREVVEKAKRSKYTIQNWRRGYYRKIVDGKTVKIYFLPDHSSLQCTLVKEEGSSRMRWDYSPIHLAVWLKKLSGHQSKAKNEQES